MSTAEDEKLHSAALIAPRATRGQHLHTVSYLLASERGRGQRAVLKAQPKPVTLHPVSSKPGDPIFIGQSACKLSGSFCLRRRAVRRECTLYVGIHIKILDTLCEQMCCVCSEFFLLLRAHMPLARAAVLNVCLNHELNLIFPKKQGQ